MKFESDDLTEKEVTNLSFGSWPAPEPYLLEIGRLLQVWGNLEDLIGQFIGKLAGFNEIADPTAYILTVHSSFPQKLQMLESLCEGLSAEFPNLEPYKQITGRIRSLQAIRNKFAHHGVTVDPETGQAEMPMVSARGKLKMTVDTIKLHEIRHATLKIQEAQILLYNMVLQTRHDPIWKKLPRAAG